MGAAVGTYIPGAADTRGENSVCVCFLKENKAEKERRWQTQEPKMAGVSAF